MKRHNGTLEHDNDGLTTYSKEKCKFKVFSNETATIETLIAALSHLFNFNNFQLRIHILHTKIISIIVISIIACKKTTWNISRNWALLTKL